MSQTLTETNQQKCPSRFKHKRDQNRQPDTVILGYPVYLDVDPAYQDLNSKILKTLNQMASDGRKRATIKSSTQTLRILNKNVNLMEPEAVKLYIANSTNLDGTPTSDARKHKHVWNYNYFVKANDLTWTKPKYKYDLKVPITPTRDQAEAIIASAPSMNSATIFRILLETGFEGEELHCTKEKDIDTEQGIITVEGHKMHNGRSYKLKPSTTEMLRVYLRKHNRLNPFSKPSIMWQQWKIARTRASNKLSRPDLQKIPLKGLRNLSGILLWQKCHDPWGWLLFGVTC